MAFTQFTYDMDVIAKLSDSPNVDDGLTASQLKAKFDEGGKAVKDYINNVLLVEAQERPKFTGLVKSNGSALVQAEAGTDYQTPLGAGSVGTSLIADKGVTKAKLGSDVTPANLGCAVPSVAKTATLASGSWSSKTQTVSVSGVTADNHIIVTPAAASYVAYAESMVRCVTQASGSLTFQCEDVPTSNLTVNVLIVG
jgi:hypothetical protein